MRDIMLKSAKQLVGTNRTALNRLITGDRKVGEYANIPVDEQMKRQADEVLMILDEGNVLNINKFTMAYSNLIASQLIIKTLDND